MISVNFSVEGCHALYLAKNQSALPSALSASTAGS